MVVFAYSSSDGCECCGFPQTAGGWIVSAHNALAHTHTAEIPSTLLLVGKSQSPLYMHVIPM